MNDFGLARIKEEGAPVHPDDLDWECDITKCDVCRQRYKQQLAAWEDWERKKGRLGPATPSQEN